MNYFFYDLNTQFANTGDLLINKSLIDLLSAKGTVYIEDEGKPREFVEPLLNNSTIRLSLVSNGVKKITDYLEERVKLKTNKADNFFLVYTPGDLLLSGHRTALTRVQDFKKALWLWLNGVKIVRVGVSLRRLEHFNGFTESLHSLVYRTYGVRDKSSLRMARRYCFSHITFFPDLAWAYEWKSKPMEKSRKKDYTVISFRSNEYGIEHDSIYLSSIILKLKRVLMKSKLSTCRIVVSYQVEHDKSSAKEIHQFFSKDHEVDFIDRKLEIEDALSLYYDAKCIITNRLHVLLLGVIAQTITIPFIDMEGNKKIASIYEDNGLSETIVDQNEAVDSNTRKIDAIINNENNWIEKYKLAKAENTKVILNVIDRIVCA